MSFEEIVLPDRRSPWAFTLEIGYFLPRLFNDDTIFYLTFFNPFKYHIRITTIGKL